MCDHNSLTFQLGQAHPFRLPGPNYTSIKVKISAFPLYVQKPLPSLGLPQPLMGLASGTKHFLPAQHYTALTSAAGWCFGRGCIGREGGKAGDLAYYSRYN